MSRRPISSLAPRHAAALAVWVALTAILLGVAVAHAAAVQPTLEVESWPDKQQGLTSVVVLARIPDATPLPATVTIPLVPGATITWSGEINGADASGDTTIPARTVPGRGGDAVQLTATKSRVVQYEAVVGRTASDGDVHSTLLDWTQTAPTGAVTFSTRVPLDATNVIITPAPAGDPQTNTTIRQMLYTLAPTRIAVGEHYPFKVEYTLAGGPSGAGAGSAAGDAAGSGGAAGAPSSGAGSIGVVLVLGATALVVLGAWAAQRRRAGKAVEGPEAREADGEPDSQPDEEPDQGAGSQSRDRG